MFWQPKHKMSPPDKVSSDTVIPFHFMDDTMVKGVAMHWSYRFDDVLDAEELRASLERLMEIGEWRKLGARIRQNVNGKLEYHVPAKYDRDLRPCLKYEHAAFEQSIEQHPVAGRLPRPTEAPYVFPDSSDDLSQLTAPEGLPQGIEYWLYSDNPLLTLNVATFSDATVVSITWSHAVMDGGALRALFSAWTAVLEGRENDVPPFAGFDRDPILPLAQRTEPSQYYLYSRCFTIIGMIVFVFNFLLENILHPAIDTKSVCLPKSFVDRVKSDAIRDCEKNDGINKQHFSDGDIIMALWTRIAVQALNVSPDKPINIMNPLDIRGFAKDSIPTGSVFIGNAVEPSLTFLPAKSLLRDPLSKTALRIHHDLQRLRTQTQVEARVGLSHSKGGMVLVGPPSQLMISHSNMHKFRFFEVDFSSALVMHGTGNDGSRSNKAGQPSFANLTYASKTMKLRNVGPILGQDAGGNWWLSWTMRKSAWPVAERLLSAIAPA